MYVWIWRHLHGGLPGRLLGTLVLLAAAVLALVVWVFPAVESLLPYNDVTVDTSDGQPAGDTGDQPAPPTSTPAAGAAG